MANQYYDPTTWQTIDPSRVKKYTLTTWQTLIYGQNFGLQVL